MPGLSRALLQRLLKARCLSSPAGGGWRRRCLCHACALRHSQRPCHRLDKPVSRSAARTCSAIERRRTSSLSPEPRQALHPILHTFNEPRTTQMGDRAALASARSSSALQAGGGATPGCSNVLRNARGQLVAAKEGCGPPMQRAQMRGAPWHRVLPIALFDQQTGAAAQPKMRGLFNPFGGSKCARPPPALRSSAQEAAAHHTDAALHAAGRPRRPQPPHRRHRRRRRRRCQPPLPPPPLPPW